MFVPRFTSPFRPEADSGDDGQCGLSALPCRCGTARDVECALPSTCFIPSVRRRAHGDERRYFAAGVVTGARGGDEFRMRPGDIQRLDLTEPYVMDCPDRDNAYAMLLAQDEIGLSADVIRQVVRHHLSMN